MPTNKPSKHLARSDPLTSPRSPASRLAPVRPRSTQGSPRVSSDRPRSAGPRSPALSLRHGGTGGASAAGRSPGLAPPKDFSYLLKPEIYQPLNNLSVPPPFRNSPKQPAPDTPIPDLLAQGHFRAAAIAAVQALTGTSASGAPAPAPTDHARIFDLLYTRLSCLTLIDATQVAAQEVRALEDVNSAFYTDEVAGAHLVPWDLRVLVVRLQALCFGDPRRAVMSYYDLAREARGRVAAAAAAAHDHAAGEAWKDRLVDLGLKVAGALVEMEDLAGAANHLATLRDRGDGKLAMAKALLWLHLGDTDAARQCVKEGEAGDRVVSALCDMADGDYELALAKWRELQGDVDGDEMIVVNLAVCLLYTGKMQEVSTSLSRQDVQCKTATLTQSHKNTGQGSARRPGRPRLHVAHPPLQPHHHVRAVYGPVAQSQGQVGRESSRDGGDDERVGKVQRGLQVVDDSQGTGGICFQAPCVSSRKRAIFTIINLEKKKTHSLSQS